jgi:multidrug efflux pump subunit AcrA (membrane-fusion protein)
VVFVLDGDRVLEKAVRTGKPLDTMVEVLEGLEAGDRVVVHPARGLQNGARIKIQEK